MAIFPSYLVISDVAKLLLQLFQDIGL